jgi:hypothetical protein
MSRVKALCVAIGLGLPAAWLGLESPAQDAGATWVTDYAQAREIARKTGKPMFLVLR